MQAMTTHTLKHADDDGDGDGDGDGDSDSGDAESSGWYAALCSLRINRLIWWMIQ